MARRLSLKPLPVGDSGNSELHGEAGFTLVEVLVALVITAIIIVSFAGVVTEALKQEEYGQTRTELLYQAHFAMERITDAVYKTDRLLIPLVDNPATGYNESLRPVLALTLDPTLDRDNDSFFDVDNDKDGLLDEDIPPDNTNDGEPGIIGIDDDGDGLVDELISGSNPQINNDEDDAKAEDWIDGRDNDGDQSIDEDIPRDNDQSGDLVIGYDNDGDGLYHEDWLDAVVYYVSSDGKSLVERTPNINPVDGTGFTEHVIAGGNSISFSVERLESGVNDRAALVLISLQLDHANGEAVNLTTRIRAGGGR